MIVDFYLKLLVKRLLLLDQHGDSRWVLERLVEVDLVLVKHSWVQHSRVHHLSHVRRVLLGLEELLHHSKVVHFARSRVCTRN